MQKEQLKPGELSESRQHNGGRKGGEHGGKKGQLETVRAKPQTNEICLRKKKSWGGGMRWKRGSPYNFRKNHKSPTRGRGGNVLLRFAGQNALANRDRDCREGRRI